MRVSAIKCHNDDCPEYRLGDSEVNPGDPNIESEWESLEHDARLSGWVSCGDAMYCSEECKEANMPDFSIAVPSTPAQEWAKWNMDLMTELLDS